MKLAEGRDILLGYRVAGEVQPTVKEHRAVSRREDETVTVEPTRSIRIEIQGLSKQDGTDFGAPERETQMAGVAGVDSVHGKATGFIGSSCKCFGIHKGIGFAAVIQAHGLRKP